MSEIEYLVGNKKFENLSIKPFDDVVCNFLSSLSKNINNSNLLKDYSDIKTFAFMCRKSNIENNPYGPYQKNWHEKKANTENKQQIIHERRTIHKTRKIWKKKRNEHNTKETSQMHKWERQNVRMANK